MNLPLIYNNYITYQIGSLLIIKYSNLFMTHALKLIQTNSYNLYSVFNESWPS